ncbi:MAG: gluconolaconase [Hydrocarboniphaga sp.]|uniref:SMP-30/gluconolactonase/LRE family protein n=1 Tax=Hydrocarboniphaga sp. TaxID=2033016 RepID=UPI002638D50D|nr:SMP-30/gluconolactonase/LRE family protein [Hydrocarboniphaga sp.]MDB5970370.1 gluconolaconase [Hydrocarboniphaga sp.]
MSVQSGRNTAASPYRLAEGWRLERLTPASRLFGANGLRTGADGRIYVAQVSGSQISAIDVDTGAIETISPMGGEIVAPDDLVFDDEGNLYATEITEGRVSMRAPNGTTRVIYGDIPLANPITFHQGRLIAGELRMGGRIMELDRNGGAPRVIFDQVPMANAFDVGPDGKLYFPAQAANEIWRISLDGGEPEVVAKDLGVPDSVKFHPDGYIVSTQVHSGQVLRIDPRTGDRSVLANLTQGLDNVTFVGKRSFVSNISGYIVEILDGGKTRDLVPDGFNWPLGLAIDETGLIYVADGPFSYTLRPGEERKLIGMLFTPGYPGYARGVAAAGPGEFIITTANGDVARYWPGQAKSEMLASGFNQLYGVAVAAKGGIVFAEQGGGRVLSVQSGNVETLATGLKLPSGVAVGPDGSCYVSESAGGRVAKLSGGKAETVLDGLQKPQGILVRGKLLYVVDTGSKQLIEYDLASGVRRSIASELPVGAPPGVTPKFLGPIGTLSGPMGPFAGIAAGADGTLYVSADAEGSVLAIRPAC